MEREVKIYLGGDALVTALGHGVDENFSAMAQGQIGLHPIESPCRLAAAGKIDVELLQTSVLEHYTPLESLMIRCVQEAAAGSQIDPAADDCLLVFATTKGNVDLLEQDMTPPKEAFLYCLAERVAGYFNAARQPVVISNACISGVSALIVARRMIREEVCRHAIVVGGDLISTFVAEGFLSFKSVSPGPCRPYDATEEHGLSLGEAVGAVVLTTDACRAKLPAVLLKGGAITNDANHISGPSRTGDGLHYAMEEALAEAEAPREKISFVNAHGTGTAYNDAMESKALALSSLSECPMNSLKGYIGHTLGASGVVESILSAEELRRGLLFGTAGFRQLGTPCPLNVTAASRPIKMQYCLKTASGFGGCNAAIVLGLDSVDNAPDATGECLSDKDALASSLPLDKTAVAPITGNTEVDGQEEASLSADHLSSCPVGRITATYELPHTGEPFPELIRRLYKELEAPNMKFYKMDDLSKAAYIAVEYLLRGWPIAGKYASTDVAVVFENRSSSLDTDLAHQRIVNEHHPEGASPAVFVYTLPNVAVGEICIRNHIQGENTFFVEGSGATAEWYAHRLVERGTARAVIYGVCDFLKGEYHVKLNLLEAK